jgi:hypothetical protein
MDLLYWIVYIIFLGVGALVGYFVKKNINTDKGKKKILLYNNLLVVLFFVILVVSAKITIDTSLNASGFFIISFLFTWFIFWGENIDLARKMKFPGWSIAILVFPFLAIVFWVSKAQPYLKSPNKAKY